MKIVLLILLPPALLVMVCVTAVELCDDRALFVPPPDAVAEAFAREVMTKRYPRAREYVAVPLSDAQLEDLQRQLGEGENVETRIVGRDREKASVEVRVKEKTLRVGMVWRKGWRVADARPLPKVMPG